MKNRLKDYFYFSRSERNGALALLIIITALPITANLINYTNEDTIIEDSLIRIETEAFLSQIRKERSEGNRNDDIYSESYSIDDLSREDNFNGKASYRQKSELNTTKSTSRYKPVVFNPNTASVEDFCQMGFSIKQAASIIKYRTNGGYFKVKEDFARLYVVSEETYRIFEPFISLPHVKDLIKGESVPLSDVSHKDYRVVKAPQELIELNSADSLKLLDIRGVGPVFASRILKYRNKLGGFISCSQLLEVYGLDSTRYAEIINQIEVDTLLIEKIPINTITLDELRKHPYFNYYSAKALIDRRIQLGRFTATDEVKLALRNHVNIYLKIKPYILL